jgi:hypothetical protein
LTDGSADALDEVEEATGAVFSSVAFKPDDAARESAATDAASFVTMEVEEIGAKDMRLTDGMMGAVESGAAVEAATEVVWADATTGFNKDMRGAAKGTAETWSGMDEGEEEAEETTCAVAMGSDGAGDGTETSDDDDANEEDCI